MPSFDGFIPAIVDPTAPRDPRWFIFRYRLHAERGMLRVLSAIIGLAPVILRFECRLPRRPGTVQRFWFPTYAFLHFDHKRDRYQQIRRVPGVIGFLGHGEPMPMATGAFADLIARCPAKVGDDDAFTVIPAGTEVEVLHGAFRGLHGVVAASRGETAWVELMAFNRPTRVELRTRQIRVLS